MSIVLKKLISESHGDMSSQEMNDKLDQIEALNLIESLTKPVLAYANQLTSVSADSHTAQEKLWLLAYQALNNKFAEGTEQGMTEAVEMLPILKDTIPDSNSNSH